MFTSSPLGLARPFAIAGKVLFVAGTAISVAQAVRGDIPYWKAGLDIGMGVIGVWGGPPGAIIAGGYFLIDNTIGWEEFAKGICAIHRPITAREMLIPRLGPINR